MNEEFFRFARPVRVAVISLFSLGAVFLLVASIGAIKSWKAPANATKVAEITVNGTGDAFAVPDVATFSYTVNGKGATVKDAQDKASATSNAALDYLTKQGIDKKDIKTVSYDAGPDYEYQQSVCKAGYCPPSKQVITGYHATESVEVKVRDTDKAGTILTGVGALGVENVSSLQFTVDDESVIQAQARQKAIDDAKAKADVLARDLGVSLIRITNFSEGTNGGNPIFYESKAMDVAGQATPAAAPIQTGQNKFTSNVTISYEIR